MILRNPASVFETWTGNIESLESERRNLRTYSDPTYERHKIKLGHGIQGPQMESFHVTRAKLANKIQEYVEEKFGKGRFSGEIAILFADTVDFNAHAEQLRKEMGEKLSDICKSGSIVVDAPESYKGREAPIVFLITNGRRKRRNEFYLGASRCTSHLIHLILDVSKEEDSAAERTLLDVYRNISLPQNSSEEDKKEADRAFRRTYLVQNPKTTADGHGSEKK